MYYHTSLDLTSEEVHPESDWREAKSEICIRLGVWATVWMTAAQARELVAALCESIPVPLFPDETEPWPDRKELLDGAE